MTNLPFYPWYAAVGGDDVEQGEILEACPVFHLTVNPDDPSLTRLECDFQDVVVLTQSCDMVKGRIATALEDKKDVLVGVLLKPNKLEPSQPLASKGLLNNIRAGRVVRYHLLAKSDVDGFEGECRIVAFDFIRILPLSFVRAQARHRIHLRLLPPYRERLSQAFANYFMRIGLPVDIPEFH